VSAVPRNVLVAIVVFVGLVVPRCSAMTLHVWEFPRIQSPADPNDRFSWIRGLCTEFEASHPGVVVQLTELTWRQGEDKLKIAVYAGAAPDLTSGILPLSFVRQGVVSPADPYLTDEDRRDYFAGALSAFTWQGTVWGWPWCSKCDALFLNTTLFRERGVEPPRDGRWTLDEFLAAARRLTFDRDGDGTTDVWGLGYCFGLGRTAEFGLLLQPGSELLSSDGASLAIAETAAGRAGFGLMRDLAGRFGVAPPSAGGASDKDVWLSFAERRSTAMIPCGLWALGALRKKQPFDFALAHFPDAPDGTPRVLASTAGYYVFRKPGADPRREALAHALARHLTSGRNQAILRQYGQFPTRRSAGDLYGDDADMQRAAAICRYARPVPATPVWAQLDEELKRNLQLAALGELPVDAAADRVTDRARVLLAGEAPGSADAGTRAAERPSSTGSVVSLAAFVALLFGLVWFGRSTARLDRRSRHDERTAWLFLLPSVAVIGLFFVYPAFQAVLLAFQDYRVGQGLFDNIVGVRHFRRCFDDPVFFTSLVNTVVYTAVVVPANLLTGLVLASLIAPLSDRWRHLFRGAFYLPGVTSVVVLAMVWRWLYDVEYGVINGVLLARADTPWGWVYQFVRNAVELPPALPRFVLWAGAIALLALVLRWRPFAGMTARLDEALQRRWGSGPGLVGRSVRAVAFAAGDYGPTTFIALSVGTTVLAVAAMLAVPWAHFDVKPIGWLTTTQLSLFSIMLSMVVRGPGGALIIYLAALESCPRDLYEVAEIDGAGPVASWWHITLPLLRPTTLFLLVTQTIGSFQVFAQVSLLTDGGPGTSSSVLVHRIYTAAFRDLDFGYASAMAMVLFGIIAVISAVQFVVLGDEGH